MSTSFEDRLERELVDAARRRQRRGASSRLRHAPHRRLPLRGLAVACACAALLVAAALVVALPGGEPAPPVAPQRLLPRQCDEAAARGQLRLVATPVDRRLLASYAVLRRPQTEADRSVCPGAAMTGLLNPGTIRLAGDDHDGHPLFLVPMAGVPDVKRAVRRGDQRPPEEIPDRTGPRLCPTIVRPDSGAGGLCYPPSYFGRGRFLPETRWSASLVTIGVFEDGVTAVDVRFRDGAERQVQIRDNVAVLQLAVSPTNWANTITGYDLLDAEGRVLATRGAGGSSPLPPLAQPRDARRQPR